MRMFLVVALFAAISVLLLIIAIKGNKQREPSIQLTQEQFMIIYKNAYLRGRTSAYIGKDTWVDDSTSIVTRFSPFFK